MMSRNSLVGNSVKYIMLGYILTKNRLKDLTGMWFQKDGAKQHAKKWPNREANPVNSLFRAWCWSIALLDNAI